MVPTILPVVRRRAAGTTLDAALVYVRRPWPSHRFPFDVPFGVQLNGADATGGRGPRRAGESSHSATPSPRCHHFTEQLAPLPALQAVLGATTTLRAGALVFDNDYKHPAVLAKELATMDVLSEGRVEIGLGAGWMIRTTSRSASRTTAPGCASIASSRGSP